MTMKILTARLGADGVTISVHLDKTKLDGKGQPDTDWIATFKLADSREQGESRASLVSALRPLVQSLARDQLAIKKASLVGGTTLAIEGEEF